MIISSPISQSRLPLFRSNSNMYSSFPPRHVHLHRSLTPASTTSISAVGNSNSPSSTSTSTSSILPPSLPPSSSSTSTSSFYDILGISMGATFDEIKSAFRKLVRVYHPDVTAKESPNDEFLRIHAAYSTLSDPMKRANYDRGIFRRHRSFTVLSSSVSGSRSPSPLYTRRNWETDQCW